MVIRVFISKGSAANNEQRQFVDAVLEMLEFAGLSPRIMGENEWSFEQPLRAIRKIMKECDGAVVIAFTRTKFKSGVEYKKDNVLKISDVSLPTTWNHIEASMAYAYGLPLLVVAENGLKPEGLIEDGYDWRVYWTDLNPEVVKSDSFKGFLHSWKAAVEEAKRTSKNTEVDFSKISFAKLMSTLSLPQIWKVIGAILTVLTLVAGGAYSLGSGKLPWQTEAHHPTSTTPTVSN